MRQILLVGAVAGCLAWAQSKPVDVPATGKVQQAAGQADRPRTNPKAEHSDQAAGMASSIAKQRVAALKQISAVMGKAPPPAASFYTVPWIDSPIPFSMPPCDPVPEAELDKLVEQNSKQAGVKPELIRAVIMEESGARPCAVSWKGAQGLMQLMPATADDFGVQDPFDPAQSVEAGTKLLKQLLAKYNNDVTLALAAYNAGEGRVDKDGAVPQIPETQNYVKDIQTKLSGK
jgi:soluble lytic murein transglycosylase-like protein